MRTVQPTTMNGQPSWSDYGQGQQPMQGGAGNLNFVSTSFDPGRAQSQPSYTTGGYGNNMTATTSFDDEPPLLEGRRPLGYRQSGNPLFSDSLSLSLFALLSRDLAELGIDITSIFKKTGAVFSFGSTADGTYDSDLSGPIVFILGLGFSHMLVSALAFSVPRPSFF